MKYLFEKFEEDICLSKAVSNQIAFAFSEIKNPDLETFEKIAKSQELRIEILSVRKENDQFVVCFNNEEIKNELAGLL